jgi:RHS repeat-associated protein
LPPTRDQTIQSFYNANDQLTGVSNNGADGNATSAGDVQYTYDADGSTTQVLTVGGGTVKSLWDVRNRLAATDGNGDDLTVNATTGASSGTVNDSNDVVYRSDDAGLRASKTVPGAANPTLFHWDTQNPTGYAQVTEQKTGTSTSGMKSYVLGMDVIAQGSTSTATTPWALVDRYFIGDGLGSTRALTSSTGALVSGTEAYNYDAFGVALGFNADTAATSLLFTGEYWDAEKDSYFLRGRPSYEPGIGRFSSFDDFQADGLSPSKLHKYLYGQHNPVYFVDPSGNEFSLGGLLTSTTIRAVLTSILIGAVFGSVFTGVDAFLQGYRGWDLAQQMFVGGVIGGTLAPLFLTPAAPFLAGVGIGLGIGGTWNAIEERNYELAAFRGLSTAFAGYATYRQFILPSIRSVGTLKTVDLTSARYSQRSAGGKSTPETLSDGRVMSEYMKRFGNNDFEPPVAVDTPDGICFIDNTRPAAAVDAGFTSMRARVVQPNDPLPPAMIRGRRFEFRDGRVATTWGEALAARTARNRLPPTGRTTPPPIQ